MRFSPNKFRQNIWKNMSRSLFNYLWAMSGARVPLWSIWDGWVWQVLNLFVQAFLRKFSGNWHECWITWLSSKNLLTACQRVYLCFFLIFMHLHFLNNYILWNRARLVCGYEWTPSSYLNYYCIIKK